MAPICKDTNVAVSMGSVMAAHKEWFNLHILRVQADVSQSDIIVNDLL